MSESLIGKYWHELTEEEMKLLHDSHVTVKWVLENLKQPDWCDYPEALYGGFGCNSLMQLRTQISKDYCKNCDLCNIKESE